MEPKKICPQCEEEEVYSETLTNGLCLNCYVRNREESRLADIEAELDYYDGSL